MKNNLSISSSEKISLISNLSTMLTAGIPILEAVDSLIETSKGNLKKILVTLREDLTQGKRIHSSIAKFPRVFSGVDVNIIKAAEEAGTLEVTLKDLKLNLIKEVEFTDKIKASLIYPIFIFLVLAGELVLILTFVIPRVSSVFKRLKADLPLPTQILIATSDFLLKYPVLVVGGIAVAIILLVMLYKRERKLMARLFFSLPLISDLARQIDLTRFSRSLFLLLSSGIPITSALDFASDVAMKSDVARAISYCREVVLSGRTLSEGFKERKKIFPSVMVKITEAGERAGTLERSMQDITENLDYEVLKTLRTVTTLLEPVMLLVVGVLIGGVLISIIAPIYSLIGKVGSR